MFIRGEHSSVCVQGFEYLMKHQLVDDTAEELAKFLHSNRQLDPQKKREFLSTRLADALLSFHITEYACFVPVSTIDHSVTVCLHFHL